MSKYVIIHGRLHEITDEELMHFKYIKREKKNGRWVYYYDEKSANADLSNQQNAVTAAKANELAKKQEYDAAKAAADAKGLNDGRKTFYGDQIATLNKQVRAENKYKAAVKKTEKVVKNYEKMKTGQNVEKAVSKGVIAITKLFSKKARK